VIVCHCERVGSAAVQAAIGAGATTVSEVTERCGAGGDCGSCWFTIESMLLAVGHAGPTVEVAA
jgi:bacterioferritin-associated ferredoxin